jgi:predicted short-subunit dehydrogenase-like oxidoreductase (DUF2520 family)
VTHPDDPTAICSDVVFIAVPDPQIGKAADAISKRISGPSVVFHISGSLPSKILFGKFHDQVSIGSMHPLVALSDPDTGSFAFTGAYFCLEGDPRAIDIGREIATGLGGKPFTIGSDSKALYHAAAVISAGHVVALFDIACEVLEMSEATGPAPSEILLPLLESVVINLKKMSTSRALTGSFARGDIGTIERHLEALKKENLTDALDVYRILGRRSTLLASSNGLDEDVCHEVLRALNLDKGNFE